MIKENGLKYPIYSAWFYFQVDKEPLERDTINLNKAEQKNSDMEETQKGMHSLSHPASLSTGMDNFVEGLKT